MTCPRLQRKLEAELPAAWSATCPLPHSVHSSLSPQAGLDGSQFYRRTHWCS